MKSGFTLMEVLISLAIMAMVMTTVMQTVDSTRMAVDAIHNVMETENTGPRILDRMREDLENIAIYDIDQYRLLKGEDQSLLGAEADRLDLLVADRGRIPVDTMGLSDERQRFAALNEVGYRLRQNPRRQDFMELYRREDPLVDADPFRDGSYTMLYDRVVGLQIRYCAEPDLNPVWIDDWDTEIRQTLPFAIDIFLEIEVQPRRSLESLNILGANRARLEFNEVYHVPERTRWKFRHRLHSTIPGEGGAGTEGAEGEQEGLPTDGLGEGADLGDLGETGTR